MTEQTKHILFGGAAILVGIVVIVFLRKRSGTASTGATQMLQTAGVMPGTADFAGNLSGGFGNLGPAGMGMDSIPANSGYDQFSSLGEPVGSYGQPSAATLSQPVPPTQPIVAAPVAGGCSGCPSYITTYDRMLQNWQVGNA